MKGSIRRRGKRDRNGEDSWEITLDLGRDAQGRRLRKYVTVAGRKADAEKKLRELLSLSDHGIPILGENPPLAEWLARWLCDYVAPRLRPKSYERYEEVVRLHLVPHLGHMPLTKVAPADIQGLEAKLLAQGMSPAAVDTVHNVLSGAFKYALRMEVVWRNPVQAVTGPKIIHKDVKPPEIATVKRILDLARQEQDPFYPCLHLLAYSGMRRGEVLGLQWANTDLEASVLAVAQALGRSRRQGLVFQPPKTNAGRRTIDLDASTVAVLRAHRGQQLLAKMQAEGAYDDRDLVFADPLGAPLNPMALTRHFQSLAKRVGVAKLRLHSLRHLHASLLLQNGQSPVLVARRLGHASVTTTMNVYAHQLPGWQREAANAFAKAMERG